VRKIKLFAVIGLAVALMGVLAMAQASKPVNVTCEQNQNKIKVDVNPVQLSLTAKETVRWIFSSTGGNSVGACKIPGELKAVEKELQQGQSLSEKAPAGAAFVKITTTNAAVNYEVDGTTGTVRAGQPAQVPVQPGQTVKVTAKGDTKVTLTFLNAQGGQITKVETLGDWGLAKIEIALLDVRDLLQLNPPVVDWKEGGESAITGTPLKVGESKYSIKFLDKDGKVLHEVKEASVLTVQVTPTLTEWGLIALAVLLAGGMGYMIYRRRPALRPAAP
jgi:plastocyanin